MPAERGAPGAIGFGYDERCREESAAGDRDKAGSAMFGGKADKYEAEFQQFTDSGMILTGTPPCYRKIMGKEGMVRKNGKSLRKGTAYRRRNPQTQVVKGELYFDIGSGG